MKIAITSTNNELSSKTDMRFGRCSYFAIVNTDTNAIEFLENPSKNSDEGAGPAAVQFIANLGVQKVISGKFGGKAADLLQDLGIEMQVFFDEKSSIAEIVHSIN